MRMLRSIGRVVGLAAILVRVAAAQAVAAHGQVVTDTVHSQALEKNLYGDSPNRSMLVYLPPSYTTDAARRYPVIYLLHGFSASETSWIRGYSGFNIGQAMDSLVDAGAAREMIIVMPNGKNRFNGSFYTNSATSGNWEDFIARELVAYVDAKYRTIARPESRGLAGHSMGGYGTFTIGMRNAGDVYGALYSMSGCCTQFSPSPGNTATWARLSALTTLDSIPRLTFIQQVNLAFAAAFSPNAARPPLYADLPFVKSDSTFRLVKPVYAKWVEHAPYDMVPRYRDKLRQLRGFVFDVGTSDTLVPLSSQAVMDSALTRAGVAHTYETYDGDHVNRVGLRMVTRVLPFFSRTLDFGPH